MERNTFEASDNENCGILQVRALHIQPGSSGEGKTVDQIEETYGFRLKIETIARDSCCIPGHQTEILHTGDISSLSCLMISKYLLKLSNIDSSVFALS